MDTKWTLMGAGIAALGKLGCCWRLQSRGMGGAAADEHSNPSKKTGNTMKMPNLMEVVKLAGCLLSLLALSVALFGEAVDRAAAFDFNTPIHWDQFRSSIPLVTACHIKFAAHDLVGLAGMVAMLAWTLSTKAKIPFWLLTGYSAVYFAVGGFLGIIAMVFGWFLAPIDGEFFQDGVANALGHSCWGFMLILIIAHRYVKKRNLVVEIRGSLQREREKATDPTSFGL